MQAGFTQCDTAPYYGFGSAKKDAGALRQRHPKSPSHSRCAFIHQGLWCFTCGACTCAAIALTVDFAVIHAQAMLAASLQRLKTQHTALYPLHEPDPRLEQTDELQRWLEAEVARGRISAFGIALTREELLPCLCAKTTLALAVQMLDSLNVLAADCMQSN